MWQYIAIAAGTGAVWSAVSFLKKVADKTAPERWKDWDWFRFVWTVFLNALGAAAGILGLIYFTEAEPSIAYAVASGLFGEAGIGVLLNWAGAKFPPK